MRVHLPVSIGNGKDTKHQNWYNARKKENAQNLVLDIGMKLKFMRDFFYHDKVILSGKSTEKCKDFTVMIEKFYNL